MKLYQIYFSPTGGTKKAAESLSDAWDCEKETIDLMDMGKSWENRSFSEEDVCIIAVPSFGGRVPKTALERLRTMDGKGSKAVLMAVYGNRAIDDTLIELKDEAEKIGFIPVAAAEAVAEHSIIRKFGTGRPDEEDKEELKSFGKQIREKLESFEKNGKRKELDVPGNRPYREYNGVPMKPEGNKNCGKCGLCVAECPVQAIPKDNPASVDKEKCISCMHCIAICPNHARQNSKVILFAAEQKMKKACSGRKDNRLYQV